MTDDLTLARNRMVDGQIRPVRVNDPRIIAAMRTLPRENYVPRNLQALAYVDRPIELGGGRQVMEPRVLARLIQIAQPRRGDRALVVGANTGYGAAVLAHLGLDVTALEQDEHLIAVARTAIDGARIAFRHGPHADGLPAEPPFDLVLVEGGVERIPPAIERCLAPGHGRLVTVMLSGGTGQGVVAEHSGAGLAMRPHFDASARLLPGFGAAPTFRF